MKKVDTFSDKNPLEIMLTFMAEKKLRLVDLFKAMDKDQSGSLERDEFIEGLQVCPGDSVSRDPKYS